MELQIITPPTAETPLDDMLVEITKAIADKSPDNVAHGFLGGEFGYGAHYENSVFIMRPYYWGDCDCGWQKTADQWSDDNRHTEECYYTRYHYISQNNEFRKKVDAALEERSKYQWCSKEETIAQKKVEEWSKAERKYIEQQAKAMCKAAGIPWNKGYGSAVHCTCGHDKEWEAFRNRHGGHKITCSLELPNFFHRASGLEVRWYKWIGRDMEVKNVPTNLTAIFNECLTSIIN